ncbi:MAG: mevalonate kinase [Candidatus Woesebacteria bacterium]
MIVVTASAPGKLLLFGDHAVVYGRPCIVTAVDQRLWVTVKKNGIDVFHLEAPDLGLSAYSKTVKELGKKEVPKSVSFIEHVYKRFLERFPQKEGIIVTTKSDFSSNFGFGSSSAVTVAFAKALTTLYGISYTKMELFELCYQAVLDVQGVGSGFDIAAAIWGGTIYYVSPAKIVEQLDCPDLSLIVGYTGMKADTPTLIRMVESQYKENEEAIGAIFDEMGTIVDQAREVMKDKKWKKVGELMIKNQQLLAFLKVSSVQLDAQINASIKAGAYGAKLSGAGGGDCMVAVSDPSKKDSIESAIQKVGGIILPVNLNARGVTIEK